MAGANGGQRNLVSVALIIIGVFCTALAGGVGWTLKTTIDNKAMLQALDAKYDARLTTLEEKTKLIPPADYRGYIDAKFLEIERRMDDQTTMLDRIDTRLQVHDRETRP